MDILRRRPEKTKILKERFLGKAVGVHTNEKDRILIDLLWGNDGNKNVKIGNL